jgi:hypothetical protein
MDVERLNALAREIAAAKRELDAVDEAERPAREVLRAWQNLREEAYALAAVLNGLIDWE